MKQTLFSSLFLEQIYMTIPRRHFEALESIVQREHTLWEYWYKRVHASISLGAKCIENVTSADNKSLQIKFMNLSEAKL